MKPHDVLLFGRVAKAEEHPFPHVASCAGCRDRRICHGCGATIDHLTRCTSGACRACCHKFHRHPQG